MGVALKAGIMFCRPSGSRENGTFVQRWGDRVLLAFAVYQILQTRKSIWDALKFRKPGPNEKIKPGLHKTRLKILINFCHI